MLIKDTVWLSLAESHQLADTMCFLPHNKIKSNSRMLNFESFQTSPHPNQLQAANTSCSFYSKVTLTTRKSEFCFGVKTQQFSNN